MSATFDFTGRRAIITGDDFSHEFLFQDAAGEPLPLSGSFYAQIRQGGNLLASFTCAIGGADNNVVTISLASSVTEALTPTTNAVWDLEHHTPSVKTIISGEVEIRRGVTEVP